MMNNNHNTRAFAESIGRATAFGQDIVTCDMLLNTQSCGYYYYATDEEATVVSQRTPRVRTHTGQNTCVKRKPLPSDTTKTPKHTG